MKKLAIITLVLRAVVSAYAAQFEGGRSSYLHSICFILAAGYAFSN